MKRNVTMHTRFLSRCAAGAKILSFLALKTGFPSAKTQFVQLAFSQWKQMKKTFRPPADLSKLIPSALVPESSLTRGWGLRNSSDSDLRGENVWVSTKIISIFKSQKALARRSVLVT